MLMSSGMMNQLGQLALSHFAGPISENEEQCVDGIRFTGSVWANDGAERLACRTTEGMSLAIMPAHLKPTLWNGPISCLPA